MESRGVSTFALGAILVVLVAGMVVMTTADASAASDVGLLPSGGETQSEDEAGSALLTAKSANSEASEHYQLYEELTTYDPRGSSSGDASRADEEPEAGRQSVQPLHRWECPICDATKLSLGAPTGDPAEEAANNLRSHVMNSDGTGHGPPGTVPPELTPDLLRDHVLVVQMAD